MKILVYWNRKDNDCKKIFHFMSVNDVDSIYMIIDQFFEFSCIAQYSYYNDLIKDQIIQSIKDNDLIIFLTHGEKDCILKYRNDPNYNYQNYILLNKDNASVLNNKKVIALCCSSAKKLGRYCVENASCNTYIGFETDIVYDNGRAGDSRNKIYNAYKKAFRNAIYYLCKHNCTGEQFTAILRFQMRKQAAIAVLGSNDNSINTMFMSTTNGVVALGDVKSLLIS